jgi:hypothetical protein
VFGKPLCSVGRLSSGPSQPLSQNIPAESRKHLRTLSALKYVVNRSNINSHTLHNREQFGGLEA